MYRRICCWLEVVDNELRDVSENAIHRESPTDAINMQANMLALPPPRPAKNGLDEIR